jgi:bacterioferritin-associated ferredoxin
MIVCLCNGIREKDFSRAFESGANSVAAVYQNCGCAPQCGKCVPFVREQLSLRNGSGCEQ